MANAKEMEKRLENIGFGKTEAAVYIQLLLLADRGPATGYQVAKELGKDPTTVYKALKDLQERGAVETVVGRGKEFRAVSPKELTDRMEADYSSRIRRTARSLENLPIPAPEEEVFRLHTQSQTLDRFGKLLDECSNVALLDLAPDMLSNYRGKIREALDRGVSIVMKLYEEPRKMDMRGLESAPFTVEPDGKTMLKIMPGRVLQGVFDCRAQVVAYMPRDWKYWGRGPGHSGIDSSDPQVPQAFWTPNRFLAYQAHSGLASEILHTELRAMLIGGIDRGEMLERQNKLSGKIHGPVNWEEFWNATGFGSPIETGRRERAMKEARKLPLENSSSVLSEMLARKMKVVDGGRNEDPSKKGS